MPEESPSLANYSEVVHISLASLNGTLCYICWSICPSTLNLSDSMPVIIIQNSPNFSLVKCHN